MGDKEIQVRGVGREPERRKKMRKRAEGGVIERKRETGILPP